MEAEDKSSRAWILDSHFPLICMGKKKSSLTFNNWVNVNDVVSLDRYFARAITLGDARNVQRLLLGAILSSEVLDF